MVIWQFLFISACVAVASTTLLKDIKQCKRDDAECLKNSAQLYVTKHSEEKGLFRNKLDPLEVTKLAITRRQNSPVSVDLTLNNVILKNIKGGVFKKLRVVPGTTNMELEGSVDFDVTGQYEILGSVLVLPITGNGDFRFKMDGTNVQATFYFDEVQKNGKQYWNVKKVDVKLRPEKLAVHLANLFNGNKALGDNMNTVINDNWQVIWEELHEPMEEAVSAVLHNIINGMFSKHAVSDLFLP